MDWVTTCLADGDHEDWTPTLCVRVANPPNDEGKIVVALEIMCLSVPFTGSDEKVAAMTNAGMRLARDRKLPTAAALITEAWMSRNPPPGMEPKDDAFRSEVILVAAMTAERACCMATAPVSRINGKMMPIEFGELRTKDVRFRLLEHFYLGYARALMGRIVGATN